MHASQAELKVGPVLLGSKTNQRASYLASLLSQAPYLNGQVVPKDELWILQLEKLVVNSVINPLTAVLRCKNGALFTDQEGPIAQLIDVLLLEASRVLQTLIQDQSADAILQTNPSEAILSAEERSSLKRTANREELLTRFSQPQLKTMLYNVGRKVGENTSSMLQDVRAGKPTEVHEFNGWLVEMAAYLNRDLDVAHHKTLVTLVEDGTVLDAKSLGERFPHLWGCEPLGTRQE
ncbi:putative 2-dehydropantoate 2-reductase [Colletotrichum chlorophyti]|uniref:Putative 2-dehydropantoate 2-reductase n=1 Tax=Colletotrichum chlorophyti TaxID=708187 RepID=A0A1Q8S2B3_9PEZI|nr:putative 2-dehydropantoate 2-reductase [Colletotrichum chlorophyti]